MTSIKWAILGRVGWLFISLFLGIWAYFRTLPLWVVIGGLGAFCAVVDMLRSQQRIFGEIEQFLLSLKYRDFARMYDTEQGARDVKVLRSGFNEVNRTITVISREKEMHYLYLQRMLEFIDTGILLYKKEDGQVIWMNEALKNLLDIPFLSNVQGLQRRNEPLYAKLLELGSITEVFMLARGLEEHKVLLTSTSFFTEGTTFKLVAVKNVHEVLAENELKSWQKLLSVLTHEIMNSVAPISSLADTLKKRLQLPADSSTLPDVAQGIDTIKSRSEGLIRFTEVYRNLNKISRLQTEAVRIGRLFEDIYRLLSPTLEQKGIELDVILPQPHLTVIADKALMEQVLINLVLNAIDAVREVENPLITLTASRDFRTEIAVSDNGSGMSEDVMDKIFVPFFSTKKKGSGIGLSICQQIMSLHKGLLLVRSKEGQGAVFTLQFPQ
jgi:two-component system nitrogen regulation sensor histidine kinase NtrY